MARPEEELAHRHPPWCEICDHEWRNTRDDGMPRRHPKKGGHLNLKRLMEGAGQLRSNEAAAWRSDNDELRREWDREFAAEGLDPADQTVCNTLLVAAYLAERRVHEIQENYLRRHPEMVFPCWVLHEMACVGLVFLDAAHTSPGGVYNWKDCEAPEAPGPRVRLDEVLEGFCRVCLTDSSTPQRGRRLRSVSFEAPVRRAAARVSVGRLAQIDQLAAAWKAHFFYYGIAPEAITVAETLLVAARLAVMRTHDNREAARHNPELVHPCWVLQEMAAVAEAMCASAPRPRAPWYEWPECQPPAVGANSRA